MGGKSKSSQRSTQQSFSNSFIAPWQVPLFQQLGNQASQLAFGQLPAIQSQAFDLGGTLQRSGNALLGGIQDISQGRLGQGFNQAVGGLTNLLGGELGGAITDRLLGTALPGQSTLEALAGGGQPASLSGASLLQSAGQGFGQLATQPNPGLQGSIDALNAAIQSNLESTAGTIAGQATLAGATGGSRQALATGLAAQEATRQFSQGASGLISQDFQTRQQLAPQLLAGQISAGQALQQGDLGLRGLTQQGQLGAAGALQAGALDQNSALLALLGTQANALQGAGQLGVQGAGVQSQAGLGGVDALGSLFNLGLAPFSAAMSPLLGLSQILGAPTVLNQGTSFGTSKGRSSGFNILPF